MNDTQTIEVPKLVRPRRAAGMPVVKETKHEAKAEKVKAVSKNLELKQWAFAYIIITLVLSMGLNAKANVAHCPTGVMNVIMAAGIGMFIPILVVILGKVAGLLYKKPKLQPFSYVVGTIGIVVLLLSVCHCTESISTLTGSNWWLSLALAIGIDCGLVACEVTAVLAE